MARKDIIFGKSSADRILDGMPIDPTNYYPEDLLGAIKARRIKLEQLPEGYREWARKRLGNFLAEEVQNRKDAWAAELDGDPY